MRQRKTQRPATRIADLARYMSGLHADQQRLTEIQGAYDNLALLGQLLCAGTDITGMRQDFNELADQLLEQLAREHFSKAAQNLGASARVAIDVLVRNLFERTADIGFLASDGDICAFAQAAAAGRPDEPRRHALEARFAEYVRKYSVYHDIILLSPEGDTMARLQPASGPQRSHDPLIAEALGSDAAYLEIFRPTDLLPGNPAPLIYARRVVSATGDAVGVLCLCFRFEDECRRIFNGLVAADDWTVLTLLDGEGKVIASSDPYQIPTGASLEPVTDDACRVIRFAGREYLATTHVSHGYQGYAGPGWVGHALAPLHHAFQIGEEDELAAVPDDFVDGVLATTHRFSPVLRDIPLRAAAIQSELNRAVWNGNVWLSREPGASQSAAFAKVLLREIGSTGIRTRNVFTESTDNLYRTVLSSLLFDCGVQAELAIDIMDRNLYERANDCRWWALNPTFREEMASLLPGDRRQQQHLTQALRRINELYTVYSNLILFDRTGRVLAVSNPGYSDLPGKTLQASWLRPTLALPDSQRYAVSEFTVSDLYDGQPTYIYSAAIRDDDGDVLGGIAIVFDATPQFRAMLEDTLPRQADGQVTPGAFAVFAARDGRVIASTRPDLASGTPLMIGGEFFHLPPGGGFTNVVIFDGRYYAVGSAMSTGYREYRNDDNRRGEGVVALVFSPLSKTLVDDKQSRGQRSALPDGYAARPPQGGETLDIASFFIEGHWYGLRAEQVVEALDAERIVPMPGHHAAVHGCLVYNEQPLNVFDLAPLLAPAKPHGERRQPRAGGKRQVIIVQSAMHGSRYALLVDALGAVAEVARNRVESLPDMMNDGQSMIDSLVKPLADDAERRILIVLSPERILQRLGAVPATPLLLAQR